MMIIMVSGLPGSGKSYFALRLAKKIGAHYLSSDLVRQEMDAQGKYAFDDKLNVYEEMAKRAGNRVRNGEVVVVDATFYKHAMRTLFTTLAKLLHVRLTSIEIVADEELIRKRLSVPRPHSEADFSVYRFVKLQYDKLDSDHLVLESKSDNIESMLEKSVEYIEKVNERA